VQLGLPFFSPAPPQQRGPVTLQRGGALFEVHLVRVPRARRYIMRVRPDGTLRVTIPRGGSRAEALRFAERHLPWAERERAKLRPVPVSRDFELALVARARRELPERLLALAREYGLKVVRVTIRNQRSRWGSCSSTGVIALNYRLLQMPSEVRDYILIHELMHLRQPNHSRRFWALVEQACPAFREAERWLKKEGQALF
jgi:predicted metal-dependent hydrolase